MIITLTTDFGLKDFYRGMIKGSILTELPQAKILDITHEIEPFNLWETAFVVMNSFRCFPKGTVHIISVGAMIHPKVKSIVAEIEGHYFVCSDNGILSLILQEIKPHQLVEITIKKYEEINYLVKDLFVPVACHIARGGTLEVIGNKIDTLQELSLLKPAIREKEIIGMVIYIDNYGNAVTNISEKTFKEIGKTRAFTIRARSYAFTHIVKNYIDIVEEFDNEVKYHGKSMALFNNGFLEIAMFKSNLRTVGGASTLMGLGIGERVSIEFLE